jgi:hypothetical protein
MSESAIEGLRKHFGLARWEPEGMPAFQDTLRRLEPVSTDIRTGLCRTGEFLPGKRLPRPETGRAFLQTLADFGRQRPRYSGSLAAKPRKAKGYSIHARKPELRGLRGGAGKTQTSKTNDYDSRGTRTWTRSPNREVRHFRTSRKSFLASRQL